MLKVGGLGEGVGRAEPSRAFLSRCRRSIQQFWLLKRLKASSSVRAYVAQVKAHAGFGACLRCIYALDAVYTRGDVISAAPPNRRRSVIADEYLHRGLSMHAM